MPRLEWVNSPKNLWCACLQIEAAPPTTNPNCGSIAKPELVYPEGTDLQLTRPSGSGDPARNSPGHRDSGFALRTYRVRRRDARMQPFIAESNELRQNCTQHGEDNAQRAGIGSGGVNCRRVRTGCAGCMCGKRQGESKRKNKQRLLHSYLMCDWMLGEICRTYHPPKVSKRKLLSGRTTLLGL